MNKTGNTVTSPSAPAANENKKPTKLAVDINTLHARESFKKYCSVFFTKLKPLQQKQYVNDYVLVYVFYLIIELRNIMYTCSVTKFRQIIIQRSLTTQACCNMAYTCIASGQYLCTEDTIAQYF